MYKTLLYLALVAVICFSVSCRKSSVLSGGGGSIPIDTGKTEQPQIVETEPAILTAVSGRVSVNIWGFYQALPVHYAESGERYPVIIFFHGGGQYGDGNKDLPRVLEDGIPKMLQNREFPPSFTVNGKTFSFIVIAPQFTKGIPETEVETLVEYVKQNFRVDTSRIYLSGFSLGARTLCNYAAYRPDQVAAITAMGGMSQIDTNLRSKCESMAEANLPVWQFHNRNDSAWLYVEAKRFNQVLTESGSAVTPKFTTFDKGEGKKNHDCWTRASDTAYRENGKNIYEWMLSYTR